MKFYVSIFLLVFVVAVVASHTDYTDKSYCSEVCVRETIETIPQKGRSVHDGDVLTGKELKRKLEKAQSEREALFREFCRRLFGTKK